MNDITAQKMSEISNKIYEKYSERFSKLGAEIGVDLRKELIDAGIPENEVFYHPAFFFFLRTFESDFMTPVASGIDFGTLTGQVDPNKVD